MLHAMNGHHVDEGPEPATQNALPHLQAGRLVRLLPDWHADIGPISIYYAGHKQLSAKTRVFVDFIIDSFKRQGLARQLSAC